MSLSTLALGAIGLLAGWQLLHFLAARLACGRRERLACLVAALKAEARYGRSGQCLIDATRAEARGNAMVIIFPILIPAAVLALAWAGLWRRPSGAPSPLERIELMRFRDQELRLRDDIAQNRGTLRADPRFRRIGELAFEIEILRWPLVALLTIALSSPALLLYAFAYGRREAVILLPQLGLFFARSLALLGQPSGRSGGGPG